MQRIRYLCKLFWDLLPDQTQLFDFNVGAQLKPILWISILFLNFPNLWGLFSFQQLFYCRCLLKKILRCIVISWNNCQNFLPWSCLILRCPSLHWSHQIKALVTLWKVLSSKSATTITKHIISQLHSIVCLQTISQEKHQYHVSFFQLLVSKWVELCMWKDNQIILHKDGTKFRILLE